MSPYAPERGVLDDLGDTPQALTNTSAAPALQITQAANASASTSTGGAVNVDNSLSTGAGVVIYSTQAAPSGRLLAVRANNAAFSQAAVRVDHVGTGAGVDVAASGTGVGITTSQNNTTPGSASSHALAAIQNATSGGFASAANFVSSNPAASSVQVTGVETGRGSIKCAHVGDTAIADDSNASALSLDMRSSGLSGATNAQGIFIDATTGGTQGKLLNIRNNGNLILTLLTDAGLTRPIIQLGASAQVITCGTGSPESVITAPIGSMFLRSNGGAGTCLYIKESGAGSTGWIAK